MARSFDELEKDLKVILSRPDQTSRPPTTRPMHPGEKIQMQPQGRVMPSNMGEGIRPVTQKSLLRNELQSLLSKILQDKESPYYNQAQSIMDMGIQTPQNKFYPSMNAPINKMGVRPPRGYSAPRSSGEINTPSRFYSPRKKMNAPVQFFSPKKQRGFFIESTPRKIREDK